MLWGIYCTYMLWGMCDTYLFWGSERMPMGILRTRSQGTVLREQFSHLHGYSSLTSTVTHTRTYTAGVPVEFNGYLLREHVTEVDYVG